MSRALTAILALLSLTMSATTQESGVLRISVVLTDEAGNAMPVPRVQLLISDNPTSREPRRVRTGADGTIELKLPAGNYTVESDVPVAFGGRSFAWIQMLDVPAGRDTTLALTVANADANTAGGAASIASGPSHADAVAMLNRWRASIVEIWTPTRHATGFVIDARGLVATNDRTIGEATDVEVEFAGAAPADRVKVPGRVVATDRTQGMTIVWVNPATMASRPAIAPACSAAPSAALPPIEHGEKVVAMIAPMLEPMNAILGTAISPTSQSFRVDWRLEDGTAGGPVFSAAGVPIGMTFGEEERDRERDRERRRDSYVIPLTNACSVITAAVQKMSGAAAPPATHLRTDAGLPRTKVRRISDPKAPQHQPPMISGADFDITLVTPAMASGDASTMSPRSFFGYWMPYVANAPQVLLVRVSPQFGESLWKTLARGAAATQGMNLPPLKSFNSNFLRMRAYCGNTEVMPIHPFVIEMPVEGRGSIREGLYVFAQTDFGPHCSTVRLDMYSEKAPNKADTRTIEPSLFARLSQ